MKKRNWAIHLLRLVCLILVAAVVLRGSAAEAQGTVEAALIQQIIDRMSIEERVGQLFLVTYQGADVNPNSDVGQLIRSLRVGGVVISPANGNFSNEADTPRRVAELTNALQTLAFDANRGNPIPLFIAATQEGDGFPDTSLRTGFTPLPSGMALGATWRDSNALAVGRIVGQELAAVGVNLLLGPSLDVLSAPGRNQSGDLGLRALGGDPQWVGRLGRLYIQGVHQGSVARVATVARHFPGIGVSDRSPEDEVATVDRSQADLRRLDLSPFLGVTAGAATVAADRTDGLMTAHVRYRTLQGASNRPIGLDPQGLQALLSMPELASWRERGLLVSDALGAPAVRKTYDPTLQSFNQKGIARDAFLAGNDVLYLARFALTDAWPDQMANIRSTVDFFREQYRTDKTFKDRVDLSLRRILLLKRRLYSSFTPEVVLVDSRAAEERVGRDEATTASIAREAVTLISPSRDELASRLPRPTEADRLLIFSDTRSRTDCPACPPIPLISQTALEATILRLYGPSGAGIVTADRVYSLSFASLKSFLTASPALAEESRKEIDSRLKAATWLVFAMLDTDISQDANADALRLFLRDRRDLFRDKRVVVLAYGAPYYLDATEISKLTAYFGVYGKTPPFIETSVRALFQEFVPTGSAPVSVPGTNYELAQALEPDTSRPIPLTVTNKAPGDKLQTGETIVVRAGPLLDLNGRPVPDRTAVNFTFFYRAEANYLRPQAAVTRDGIAEVSVFMERPGQLEITAQAGRAVTGEPLLLTVQGEGIVTATATTAPTVTPTPSATPRATLTPSPSPTAAPVQTNAPDNPAWANLLLSLGAMLGIGGVGLVFQRGALVSPSGGLRLVLLSLSWGLVGYLLYMASLGTTGNGGPRWDGPLLSSLFAALPALWLWWRGR
ncbi:MAG: hypothetical protein KIT87_07000 [Anaerolineae bacterium]|nr:hypothetical protein [Anaerolineae bacterium]